MLNHSFHVVRLASGMFKKNGQSFKSSQNAIQFTWRTLQFTTWFVIFNPGMKLY